MIILSKHVSYWEFSLFPNNGEWVPNPLRKKEPVFRIRIRADTGILTMSDPDSGKSRIRIRILDEKKMEKNEPFFLKFNILFLDFDAALT